MIDPVARVTVTTIQRLYSILKGEAELDPELDEHSAYDLAPSEPVPVEYNPAVPIEAFDVVIVDECHRSIYGVWRQVLDYFDAFIVGLTATPNKQAFGFFNQNLVMEYTHEQAVADAVNVDFDVYRIRTEISEQGGTIDAGLVTAFRNRQTRQLRWEKLDEDVAYGAETLDRAVVAKDQIRTVIRAFKENLFTDIFPGRTEVPKTLIFAKDDSHADDIVQIVREEFAKGNEFAVKITYKSTGRKPDEMIASFRNSYNPRIAVTVDMIATGTDVRPLECVFFMRSVKSRTYFEQMKGRGARIINEADFQSVTPDARAKSRFVIVDAVGVTDTDLADTQPLERKPTIPLDRLLKQVSFGNRDPEVISSIAGRVARLDRQLTREDREELEELAGMPLRELTSALVAALDPDRHLETAQQTTGVEEPSEEQIAAAAKQLVDAAAEPLAANPKLRERLVEVRRSYEQTIDESSKDEVIAAGYSVDGADRARQTVDSFREFIEQHKDEITALQILYSRPYQQRPSFKEIKELARRDRPPAVPMDARDALAGVRDARPLQGPRLRRTRADRHRLARALRARARERARALSRARDAAVPNVAAAAGERRTRVHARAAGVAGADPRPRRRVACDQRRRLRLHAVRRAGRNRQGARGVRGGLRPCWTSSTRRSRHERPPIRLGGGHVSARSCELVQAVSRPTKERRASCQRAVSCRCSRYQLEGRTGHWTITYVRTPTRRYDLSSCFDGRHRRCLVQRQRSPCVAKSAVVRSR